MCIQFLTIQFYTFKTFHAYTADKHFLLRFQSSPCAHPELSAAVVSQ